MAATTALQMVNRVLRMMSEEDVTDFSGALATRVLDAVNESKRKILDGGTDWPFLFRSDGVLTTVASWTGTTANFSANPTFTSPLADSPNGVIGDVVGDKVSRIIVTGDSTYGNQSFKIVTAAASAGNVLGGIETSVPGVSGSSLAYRIFASEYLLPDTVASVESVLIESENLDLDPIDEAWTYDDLEPVPHEEIGTPRTVMVGGKSVETYNSASSAPEAKTRLLFSPIPDAAYVVRYKYRYRYPDLSATTDDLDGVWETVIDDVVRGAFAYMMMNSVGNDPALGAANTALVEAGIRMKSRIRSDGGRPAPLSAIDRRGSRSRRDVGGRLPRNFGSI